MENIESIWEDENNDVIEVGDNLAIFLRYEGEVYSVNLQALFGAELDKINIKAAPEHSSFFSGEMCITAGTTCAEVFSPEYILEELLFFASI